MSFRSKPYGCFSDSTTQSSGGTTSVNLITFDTDEFKYLVTHSTVTNSSRIYCDVAGIYIVTPSIVVSASGVNKHIDIWFRVDGTDVPRSNTHYELPISGETLLTVSTVVQVTAGQYVEVVWASTDDAGMTLLATGAASTPTRPASPSVICPIHRIA